MLCVIFKIFCVLIMLLYFLIPCIVIYKKYNIEYYLLKKLRDSRKGVKK